MTPSAIKSRRIITPSGTVDGAVVIAGGLIQEVVPAGDLGWQRGVLDVGNHVVMPGLVDTHVHINEPGRAEWEGFETGTRAAAAGGVTTLVDMPLNSLPTTTSRKALNLKHEASRGKLHVNCGFYGGVVPGNVGELPGLIEAGVLGFKAFMVDSGIPEFPPADEDDLAAALSVLGPTGLPLLVHAELADSKAPTADGCTDCVDWAHTRPSRWEARAIHLLIDLCRRSRAHVHIVHLAAADCLVAIRAAKAEGLPITVETCPHYLFLDAAHAPEGDVRFKCAPPIRDRDNAKGLFEGLLDGTIDFVVSDHSPAPVELKNGPFADAWGGISSLELGLPVLWTLLRRAGMGPESLNRWMSEEPAGLVGLANDRGVIAPGRRADLVVWDPEASFMVDSADLHCRHKMTPYEAEELFGVVHTTFLGGRQVFHNGVFLDRPVGKPILRDA